MNSDVDQQALMSLAIRVYADKAWNIVDSVPLLEEAVTFVQYSNALVWLCAY